MLIAPLKNALKNLEDILKRPLNEQIRDGVVQRFEYTFELAWKLIFRYFKEIGRQDIPNGPDQYKAKTNKSIALLNNELEE